LVFFVVLRFYSFKVTPHFSWPRIHELKPKKAKAKANRLFSPQMHELKDFGFEV
jgi:hypothetical protein